jgi:hypothetical protein
MGIFNVRDYGAVPDWSDGRTATITGPIDLTVSDAADLRVGQKLLMGDNPGTYEIDKIISAKDIQLKSPGLPPGAIGKTYDRVVVDNLPYFQSALAAMAAGGNKTAILVADGHFYLSDTLHIRQTVVIEGTGRNEPTVGGTRSSPGTWLVFPRDCDGVRLHISEDGIRGGADFSVLRNLTIYCKELRPEYEWPPDVKDVGARPPLPGQTGHGVHANCVFRAEDLTVENFGEHGFFISAGDPGEPGNASGFILDSCRIGVCGGDGVHTLGSDAHASLIINCNASVCWGWGFWDESSGNTYVTCLGQGNLGEIGDAAQPGRGFRIDRRNHDYKSGSDTSDGNATVFLSCYTEAAHNELGNNSGAFGGLMGQGGDFAPESRAFYISPGGVASCAPLAYEYRLGTQGTRIEIGDPLNPDRAITIARKEKTEPSWLTYSPSTDWWEWWNQGVYRVVFRLPTVANAVRSPAPWFPNGIFLGRDDIPPMIRFTAAPTTDEPPKLQFSGQPQTYERGDVLWNSKTSAGGPMGQVCIDSGTQSLPLGIHTANAVNVTDTTVKLDRVDAFTPGQYITIGAGAHAYMIMEVKPIDSTIDITPGAFISVGVGAAIAFTVPTAAPVNVGDIQVRLDNVEGLVPGQYIEIGDGTEAYKIGKITLATMHITPGAVTGVAIGAAIAIAGGTPIGVQTSKTVNKGDTAVSLNKVNGLMAGQNVTIGGEEHVYTVVNITLPTIDIVPINDPPGAHAFVPVGKAISFSPARFATFGSVRGTVTLDITPTPAHPSSLWTLDATYETIKLIGTPESDTTITVPSEDGWSARFLDLTNRNDFVLKVKAGTSPGAEYALANGKTQRLYIEYGILDVSIFHFRFGYNVRAESPPA